nr:uncharacterized protein LOC105464113 [Macaca nemestrina]
MCQLDGATGCPGSCLDTPGASVRLFLEEMSVSNNRLSKEDLPLPMRVGILQSTEGWNRRKRQRKDKFALFLSGDIHLLLTLDTGRVLVLGSLSLIGSHTISSLGSQAFILGLNFTISFPSALASRQLVLHNHALSSRIIDAVLHMPRGINSHCVNTGDLLASCLVLSNLEQRPGEALCCIMARIAMTQDGLSTVLRLHLINYGKRG